MGSACCVARKDTTVTTRVSGETLHRNALYTRASGDTLRRNAVYSPSWSFRWDNRRRVAGEIEIISETSHGISTSSSMEIKAEFISDRGNFSDQGSPLGNFGTPTSQKSTPTSQKSPLHGGLGANIVTTSDASLAGNASTKSSISGTVDSFAPKLSLSGPSSSSSWTTPPAVVSDPLSSQIPPLQTNSTESKTAQSSLEHQQPPLLQQTSDSRIIGLKKSPPNNTTSISEGRPSFVLSTASNDMTVGGSDGWSMRTFSQLVASPSQRQRWSFDSEFLGSGLEKSESSSALLSYSPPAQNCGICSKLLTERSSWSSQKIFVTTETSIVAVLVCGHVYHAECLEAMTQEIDHYDPSCPMCTLGEKQMSNLVKKVLRAEAELKSRSSSNKNPRNLRLVDSAPRFDVLDRRKPNAAAAAAHDDENFSKIEPSSSGRRSFAKPFLRRHFSLRSKRDRSLPDNKKRFWARYGKD